MLTWVEGPWGRGCAYHKKATFRLASVSGQVDVFVMRKIAESRPIPITLNFSSGKVGNTRIQEALASASKAGNLSSRLLPKVIAAGVPDGIAAGVVSDIAALVTSDATVIQAALEGSS